MLISSTINGHSCKESHKVFFLHCFLERDVIKVSFHLTVTETFLVMGNSYQNQPIAQTIELPFSLGHWFVQFNVWSIENFLGHNLSHLKATCISMKNFLYKIGQQTNFSDISVTIVPLTTRSKESFEMFGIFRFYFWRLWTSQRKM